MNNLGIILQARGDEDQAEQFYRKAIDSRQTKAAGLAAFNLGKLLHGRGDRAGAKQFYRMALESKDADIFEAVAAAAAAMANPGKLKTP
jgi:tetratricopeptide (TPR) repeat protein